MKQQGWRGRLSAYVESIRRMPFKYGENDCALFAAGCVKAMTGTDLAAEFRGKYTTAAGGAKLIQRAGYIDAVDLVRAHFAEVPPHLAEIGDMAVVPTPGGPALGLVQGPAILLVDKGGLAALPLLHDDAIPPRPTAIAAFRV